MSFSTEVDIKNYVASGSSNVFAFPYLFLDDAHIIVIRTNLDGSEDLLVLSTDYTLTGEGDPAGGNVTITTGNPVAGAKITIYRDVPDIQGDDYPSGLKYFLPKAEGTFDKNAMKIQRLKSRVDKTVGRGPTDTASIPTVDELLAATTNNALVPVTVKINEVAGVGKGKFLYKNGSSQGIVQVGLTDNTDLVKARAYCCAAEGGSNGDTITAYRMGSITEHNTSGFSTAGATLYLSTGGNTTEAKPATGFILPVAILRKIDATDGIMDVNLPDIMFEHLQTKETAIIVVLDDTSVAVVDGLASIPIKPEWSGLELIRSYFSVDTPGVATASETMAIQIRRKRGAVEVDMLSVKVTLAEALYHASNGTVNPTNAGVLVGDRLKIDIDAIHLDTAALGLQGTLTFGPPIP